jgi:hypothetical protein
MEQTADVRGKGTYPLSCTMIPLNYSTEVTFECGPADANVAAFTEVASTIGGRNTVEEFLACGLWPLSEKFGFKVEPKETPPVEGCGVDASSYSYYWGARAGGNFQDTNRKSRKFACGQL